MATQVQSKAILLNNFGPVTVRAAAVLPATATTTYFNVVGGQVLITSMFGIVTTATSATATNLTVNAVNTAGATTAAIAASTAIASKALGTIFALPTVGSAFTMLSYGVQCPAFLVGPGSLQFVTDATNTGALKWYVNYIGLDNGAYVAAA
jgi:hypothetical protein